jgi:hypothetical protein
MDWEVIFLFYGWGLAASKEVMHFEKYSFFSLALFLFPPPEKGDRRRTFATPEILSNRGRH